MPRNHLPTQAATLPSHTSPQATPPRSPRQESTGDPPPEPPLQAPANPPPATSAAAAPAPVAFNSFRGRPLRKSPPKPQPPHTSAATPSPIPHKIQPHIQQRHSVLHRLMIRRRSLPQPRNPHPLSRLATLKIKIPPPTRISRPDHPHNMPRSMQRKRLRLPQQFHLRHLMQHLVPLPPIAPRAASHQVLPGRQSSPRPRNHMVQRQLRRRQHHRAVLTAIPIPQQNILPRKRPRLVRNPPILQQPDHRRHRHFHPRRMKHQPLAPPPSAPPLSKPAPAPASPRRY